MRIDEFAKQLSHKLHAGQMRKDRVTPYTVHTDYVGDNVHNFYYELPSVVSSMDTARAVGYLHDSIEDCNITPQQLLECGIYLYRDEWVLLVDYVVVMSRADKNIPVLDYLKRIKASKITTAVKLADLEHNLSDLGPGNLRDKYHLCKYFLEN